MAAKFIATKLSETENNAVRRRVWLNITRVIVIAVLLVSTAIFFPKGRVFQFHYQVDQITTEPIIAPFDFDILKTGPELDRDRSDRVNAVPYVFEWHTGVKDTVDSMITRIGNELRSFRELQDAYNQELKSSLIQSNPDSLKNFTQLLREDSLRIELKRKDLALLGLADLKSTQWLYFLNMDDQKVVPNDSIAVSDYFISTIRAALNAAFQTGILNRRTMEIPTPTISVIVRGKEIEQNPGVFLSMAEAQVNLTQQLHDDFSELDERLDTLAVRIGLSFLAPNVILESTLTSERQEFARNAVPIAIGKVFENEKIVDANTRITPEIKRKLDSLEKEYQRRGQLATASTQTIGFIGRIMLSGVILFFFYAYLYTYRPAIYHDIKLLILMGLIFLSHLAMAYFFVYRLHWSEYAIPMTIAAMLVTIIFDGRISFIAMVTLNLLVGIILSNNLPFVITNLFVASLAIYTVRRLRERTQLMWSIVAIVAGYVSVILIFELIKFSDWNSLLDKVLFAATNGFLAPPLTYGLLIVIEKTFKITTNLTLLELLDFNHKLLNHLAINAPGTFKHSVDVGNLAVTSADAIGANSLLARVGAYYHDVGKVTKPMYFIENQMGGENKHNKLAPRLSAMIITSHVKDGIRLAKEYKLPQVVADFIPMHHGRSRVEYFYQQALKQATNPQDVNEDDYRYPGPRPNTKETGILMIAEAVEAASRSVSSPTPQRLETLIDSIIETRIKEGDLDECPLTFRELTTIKESIIPVLIGSLHKRIEYPGQREKLHMRPEED